VAKTFCVWVPSIKRWFKRRRQTGDVAPKPIPGRTPLKGAALKEWLPEHLKGNPDLTLEEHSAKRSRGRERHEGLRGDYEPRHRTSAGRVAARKKSPLAQERDEGARALCGDGRCLAWT
jgi:transposase